MDKNCQIIPFQNLKNRMVQTDEAKAFTASFFKDVYDQAAALTDIIAKANEVNDSHQTSGIPRQQTRAFQNVIAFTGRRGTGKTSAMLSFAEALSDGRYKNHKLDDGENPYRALQGKQFYAVQYVDSSIVSKDEDFFEILLYRMLQYLNCYVDVYKQENHFKHDAYLSEIKEKIFRLYNHYTSLRQNKLSEIASSYNLMEKNIEKHNVRNEIINLVEEYIRFLNLLKTDGNCDGKGRGFLLICIDDIDMASSAHLDILQCIYQYFMIPNVVVMITMNIRVINETVRKSFYETMEVPIGNEKGHLLRLSQEQTMDFLRKIIPSDMRITMPSWRKYDYRTLKSTLISFDHLENGDGGDRIFPNLSNCHWYEKGHDPMSPKKLIMLLLADRTSIFLDMEGVKIHFMEPDSLRNLYDLFYLLYQMKNINEDDKADDNKKEKYYKDREYNRNILLNYLYFKMILEFNLDHAVESEFKGIQAEPMDRRGRRIWDYYYKVFLTPANEQRIRMLYGNEFFNKEKNNYKISNYCFGELFRCLYFVSRLDLVDKNFVKAVLASFAFTLPQYIEMEKKNFDIALKKADNNEKKTELYSRRYSKIRDVFGYSFLGTWRKELYSGFLPSYLWNKSKQKSSKCLENKISISIDTRVFEESGSKKEFLIHLLYLFMLSTKSVKDPFKVQQCEHFESIYYIDADLDPTAFIVGSIRVNRLKNIRISYDGKNDWTLGKFLDKIGIKLGDKNDRIINQEIKNLANKENALIWFLLKHPDITYNVVKRTISHLLYYSDANLQVRPIEHKYPYQIFKQFYKLFVERLNAELKNYKEAMAFPIVISDSLRSSDVSPVLQWFDESRCYGNISVRKRECVSKNNTNSLFFQYGCGMDWTDFPSHLQNVGKDYYKQYYSTVEEAINTELDKADLKVFQSCIEVLRKKGLGSNILPNQTLKIDDWDDKNIRRIFYAIYSGNVSDIILILEEGPSNPKKGGGQEYVSST